MLSPEPSGHAPRDEPLELAPQLPAVDERGDARAIPPHDWLIFALPRRHDSLGEEEGDWLWADVE